MGKSKYILAIDHGTSGIKAALSTALGEILDFEYEPTGTIYLPDGGVEADPEGWWKALIKASGRLLTRHRPRKNDIIAVCVSSTFASTVAVDSTGRHLMNSLTWMDSRGAPYVREITRGFPPIQEGYGLRKALTWIGKTGGAPSITGKDDIGHILYIKNRLPAIYDRTHKFLGSKDYLNLRLTGEFAASYDSIQLYWLTDIRDIRDVHYDNTLLRWTGVDREKLPELKQSIDILGTLSDSAARALGLEKDVMVIMGSPDHQAAQVGSGAVRDFECHIYIGTSSWVECIVPFKKTDMFHFIASLPTAIPGKYQVTNEQDIAGECVPFMIDNIFFHRNILQSTPPPADYYSRLERVISRVPAGSGNLIFTPWLNGERAPVDDNTLRGGFFNMSLRTTSEQMMRAVYEGVAFNTRWNFLHVEKFARHTMDPVTIVGGGAISDTWCQIFADVFSRTMRKTKDPLAANARGAAFIGSVGMNLIAFDDIPALISYDKHFDPQEHTIPIYEDLFHHFVSIYKNNRRLYRKINRASS